MDNEYFDMLKASPYAVNDGIPLVLNDEGQLFYSYLQLFAASDGSFQEVLIGQETYYTDADLSIAPLRCTIGDCYQVSCTVNDIAGSFAFSSDADQAIYYGDPSLMPCGSYTFEPVVVPEGRAPYPPMYCPGQR